MLLVTMMTVLVKLGGATYPAVQMVFIRSLIGLVGVLPLAWRHRQALSQTRQWGRHSFRVLCNTLALNANFAALTALPLALVNAIGFMRPLVVLALATWLLGERSGPWRWVGAVIGFAGVLVMVGPSEMHWNLGLIAALATVLFGSLATVQTRALAAENTTVLMVFYTVGLSVFTALPALIAWQPVAVADWPLLLGIGVLAQIGQYCYLRAYQSTPANLLAPFGYLSIVLASLAGFLAFNEVPAWTTIAGIAIIMGALLLTSRLDRPRPSRVR
ncbi:MULTISPECIES: DMT family transporter [unclassified Devosia]|uniref:DMT family transporter n=1 Tax=unclassified Devosia TaxID=196773 RepID=UPI0020BF855F|nr:MULTISPECIES: DMT family transporter [unclassified Devosia]